MRVIRLFPRRPQGDIGNRWSMLLAEPAFREQPPAVFSVLHDIFEVEVMRDAEAKEAESEIQQHIETLGMPEETHQRFAVVRDSREERIDEHWFRYHLRQVGLVLLSPPEPVSVVQVRSRYAGRQRYARLSYSGPHLHLQLLESGLGRSDSLIGSLVVEIWRRVLHCDGTQATIEGRWRLGSKETRFIRGLELVPLGQEHAEVERLLGGMAFFQQVPRGQSPRRGRKKGSDRFGGDAERFIGAVVEAVEALEAECQEVTRTAIARVLLSDLKEILDDSMLHQFARYRRTYGFHSFDALMIEVRKRMQTPEF